MMRAYWTLGLAFTALAPAAANATCQPSFVSSSQTVSLVPSTLDGGQLVERFNVRLRNDGSTICNLRLATGRDQSNSDNSFPNYSLFGPNGNHPIVALQGARTNPNTRVNLTIPAGGESSISYEVRTVVSWGDKAGNPVQELVHFLLPQNSTDEIATARTILALTIPLAARVRFAGAVGESGPANVEMGNLSPTANTYSPPFAIRVLSTSSYRMDLASQNQGALVRIGGTERIPYQMTVGATPLNLSGAGAVINVPTKPSAAGDVHQVSVVIAPDPARHAGDYTDRVTVTVTAL